MAHLQFINILVIFKTSLKRTGVTFLCISSCPGFLEKNPKRKIWTSVKNLQPMKEVWKTLGVNKYQIWKKKKNTRVVLKALHIVFHVSLNPRYHHLFLDFKDFKIYEQIIWLIIYETCNFQIKTFLKAF